MKLIPSDPTNRQHQPVPRAPGWLRQRSDLAASGPPTHDDAVDTAVRRRLAGLPLRPQRRHAVHRAGAHRRDGWPPRGARAYLRRRGDAAASARNALGDVDDGRHHGGFHADAHGEPRGLEDRRAHQSRVSGALLHCAVSRAREPDVVGR